MKNSLLILILAIVLFACKKESAAIDQNQIYQDYEVVYNDQTGNTEISASFREKDASGRRLKLNGGAKVFFNGKRISGKSTFTQNLNGFISPIKIEFTDSKGTKYTNNSFGINYIDGNQNENFIKGINNYFSWYGAAVLANERVTFYAQGQDENGAAQSNEQVVFQLNANAVNLNNSFFNNFQLGAFNYWLKREETSYIGQFAAAGGSFRVVYRSRDSQGQLY